MSTPLFHAVAPWLVAVMPLARPALAPPDACALLTQAEAEKILGTKIGPPSKGGSGECHYGEEGSSAEIVVYPMMLAVRSKEEFHALVLKDSKEMNPQAVVEAVPALGDAAYYVEPSLLVLSHGRVLSITAGDRDKAVAVAAKVLPRFRPAPA
jgi:hypothetical protein